MVILYVFQYFQRTLLYERCLSRMPPENGYTVCKEFPLTTSTVRMHGGQSLQKSGGHSSI